MPSTWKYLLFILWLSYLLSSSMVLFLKGFLLNRTVLPFKSSCGHIYNNEFSNDPHNVSGVKKVIEALEDYKLSGEYNQVCIKSKTKVVLILIDALRYDFISTEIGNETIKSYQNKLTVINELLENSNSRLYKFIADPPTTTMQRINGLMTGSLPTFVDIGSNFASSELTEDNLIDQIINNNKSVVFMGDDTWMNLFPDSFIRSYPFPSFNVWDLDTVDNGVSEHLIPEIKKGNWDLIVAHFLGVDHCGHRFGPNHPEMSRKLLEMNEMIREVAATIENDTVLIVMGDHGMTDTGDHGGASDKEVTSAIFVNSPNKRLISGLQHSNEVRQIDLTPTLAALLGVPIPFSNLGTIIVDILPSFGNSPDIQGNIEYVFSLMWSNVVQINHYVHHYSKVNTQFPTNSLKKLLDRFNTLEMKIDEIGSSEDLREILEDMKIYLKSVLEMCENIWIQFDSFSMSRGLVLMFLNIFLTFILIDGMPNRFFQEILKSNFLNYGFIGQFLAAACMFVLYFFGFISNLESLLYFATNTVSIAIFSIYITINWGAITSNWHLLSKVKDCLNVVSRVIGISACFVMFSNSYTVEECCVVSFLLSSMIWLCVIDMKSEPPKKLTGKTETTFLNFFSSIKGKLILLAILLNSILRLTWYYWQCREEQFRKCYFDKSLSKSSTCIITILSFAILVTIARAILRGFGNLVGFSPSVFMSRYSPTVCVVCCGCYWVLHSLPLEAKSKLILPWQLQILPRTVLFTSVISIVIFFIRPLCVFYVSKRMDSSCLPIDNLIPALFHHLKEVMIQRTGAQLKGYPIVYGLATVYSSAFFNIAIFMSLFGAILLGESRALVIILLLISLALISIIAAVVQQGRSNGSDIFSVPWWAVLFWGFSSVYFFYGTGHQPTFPTIQWDSAFLLGDIVSTFTPGVLVVMNTFISHILHAMLLPILFITPFTLGAVWPKLMPLNDGKKGELLLFEHDTMLHRGMFSLAVKYIIFHAFRVFIAMLAACIHSRHLMVWKIFAPKLIFESAGFLITLPFVLLGVIFVERVSTSIDDLMRRIELDNR